MPDWSRFLPLSIGPSADESGVSNDWRPLVADRLDRLAVLAAATLAASPSPAEGEAASAVSLLGDLVVRLSSSTGQRLATRVGAREAASPPPPGGIPSALAALSSARRAGGGPNGVAELVEVVRVELALSSDLELPSRLSGAVALDRMQRAPLPIRAAIRGRSLAPTDAEWTLGLGPAVRAPAEEILRFLLGLGPFPTQRDA
ncbi:MULTISPECIES: hypothetical protein [unclassified Rathayibacter]|uniref:hypothetical protein n=1 Tax=unclassified Rathayibacter TaxID=2609250 RepID=UPI000701E3F1|nr:MULTISPECIES: hypothetical protein [unclassified Rathayibacter]KQQ03868.1 hypothetical protein ASF42_10435 [Rathayibacter sp. Leaf294]KQS12325.1 hypothetical protein ASG06_10435 [Rathayibacter sp. Leaf185]